MAASQTIADSKRAFHQAFPHVIAPLYRRLADELLVELHLLSHQSRFEANGLFSVGLCTVFDTFTKGYRPEAQTEALFSALCSSNGFDAAKLRKTNASLVDQAKGKDLESLKSLLSSHNLKEGSHYSRLMAVGLMSRSRRLHRMPPVRTPRTSSNRARNLLRASVCPPIASRRI